MWSRPYSHNMPVRSEATTIVWKKERRKKAKELNYINEFLASHSVDIFTSEAPNQLYDCLVALVSFFLPFFLAFSSFFSFCFWRNTFVTLFIPLSLLEERQLSLYLFFCFLSHNHWLCRRKLRIYWISDEKESTERVQYKETWNTIFVFP